MACLSTGGKQMVDNSPGEMSLTGRQRQELPTKSSPIRGPGREQWAKCRVSQFSFTQQLAENQQVGMLSTPQRQQEGSLATTRRRGTTCRQMIKITREPINDGVIPNLFVGSRFCLSTCLTPSHFDHSDSHCWRRILVSDNVQLHLTSDVSHSAEECARTTVTDGKSRNTFSCPITKCQRQKR